MESASLETPELGRQLNSLLPVEADDLGSFHVGPQKGDAPLYRTADRQCLLRKRSLAFREGHFAMADVTRSAAIVWLWYSMYCWPTPWPGAGAQATSVKVELPQDHRQHDGLGIGK